VMRRGGREGWEGWEDNEQDMRAGETSREPRRGPRGQVSLARELHVERFELPGSLQQQRGSIAAQARGEGHVGAQQVDVGALELLERPGLSRGEQPESRIKRAGLKARLCRSQRALRAP